MTAAPDGFSARPYPAIVRDLLTTLTGGTVREQAVVPPGNVIVLDQLADRPIRRVSHLEGEIEVERPVRDGNGAVVLDADGNPELETVGVPYRFTDADFELVATGAAGAEHDAIRFRRNGRRPPVGSTVTVNYYPAQTRPVPITDLNVGSVARTLLEAVARELALAELQLEHVYRSAFLDTAEASSLDKVVALVGVRRRPAGVPTVRVRFSRAPGSTGRITIPTATVVADAAGNRYSTVAPLVLEPGERSREVLTAGVSRSTAPVEAGAIRQLEVLLAGIAEVTNDAPAGPAAAPETDEELRRRARGALTVAARGTIDALRFGLLALDGVKAVTITELPNGVPGDVRVDVAYERDDDVAVQAAVRARIEELRPAGIRVTTEPAATAALTVSAALTLAGSGVPASELDGLRQALEERVAEHVRTLPPGATLRQAQVVLLALADPRIVDAAFELGLGGAPSTTITAPPGAVLEPVHLRPGVTAAEATAAIDAAARSYVATLAGGAAITVDGFLAALRDDSRYAVVRAATAVTTEAGDRFLQLADGVGASPVGPEDRVVLRSLGVDVREGGV